MKPIWVSTRISKALKSYRFRSDEDFNVMVVHGSSSGPGILHALVYGLMNQLDTCLSAYEIYIQ